MLGVSAASVEVAAEERGGVSGGSSEVGASSSIPGGGFGEEDKIIMEETERGGGGNRWPRQETLALLKIRSDMDTVFRDSSLKGPLWDEVSRKMAELGFQRSAKKCKEKFENVYKYHKRTKDGRASKPDGKSYRFFDQLEALENTSPIPFNPPPPRTQPPATTTMAVQPTPLNTNPPLPSHISTVSLTLNPLSVVPQNTIHSSFQLPSQQPSLQPLPPPPPMASTNPQIHTFQTSHPHVSTSPLSNSTSSSTSSEKDIQRRQARKRKWKHFFGRLMTDVIQKQEELQKKFLDTLEKRERDRMAREEAWRVQEMTRMNREHDLLVQERSIAAAKDAAVIAFLQKVTEQNLQIPTSNNNVQVPIQVQRLLENPPPPTLPPPRQSSAPTQQITPPPPPVPPAPPVVMMTPTKIDIPKTDNGGDNYLPSSSSRWPKAEVEALIKLRTNLDLKYQDSGPKGPLWEEISAAMGKIGYNRSSKRCKEKWENINKYFKKVKESNKKRSEPSKTCPYFHQLDAIYKERAKTDVASFNPGYLLKPETPIVPIMAMPEQQWPLPEQPHGQDNDNDSENIDHDEDDDGDNDEEEEEEEEGGGGGGYEIVTNKKPSSVTNTVE